MHREEGLDFSNVVTFNLDEYFPMEPESIHSYHRFMWENLFDHVNVPPDQVHMPRGTLDREATEASCEAYEAAIREAGGIDFQILGIGRSGHVGFNEPGSGRESRTRLVYLDTVTRADAASDFFGEENVPPRGGDHGRGDHPRGPGDRPHRHRRAQGRGGEAGGGGDGPRRRGRHVPPGASGGHRVPRSGGRRGADARMYAVDRSGEVVVDPRA